MTVDGGSATDVPGAPWLVVVDMQEIFAEPGGPWAAPGAAELVGPIRDLATAFDGRVVLTRFVAPDVAAGSWIPYYRRWPFALRPADDELYRLLPGLPDARAVVTATTFSKWGPELAAATGGGGELVVCGVATDCCVLATAIAAADAGASVRVVGDACAAGDADTHRRALLLLDGFAPMLRVTTVADEVGRRAADR